MELSHTALSSGHELTSNYFFLPTGPTSVSGESSPVSSPATNHSSPVGTPKRGPLVSGPGLGAPSAVHSVSSTPPVVTIAPTKTVNGMWRSEGRQVRLSSLSLTKISENISQWCVEKSCEIMWLVNRDKSFLSVYLYIMCTFEVTERSQRHQRSSLLLCQPLHKFTQCAWEVSVPHTRYPSGFLSSSVPLPFLFFSCLVWSLTVTSDGCLSPYYKRSVKIWCVFVKTELDIEIKHNNSVFSTVFLSVCCRTVCWSLAWWC